jgi:hypothetical protein
LGFSGAWLSATFSAIFSATFSATFSAAHWRPRLVGRHLDVAEVRPRRRNPSAVAHRNIRRCERGRVCACVRVCACMRQRGTRGAVAYGSRSRTRGWSGSCCGGPPTSGRRPTRRCPKAT